LALMRPRALREHFADSVASPSDLVDAFHDIDVSIHHNEHIVTAARAADPVRVRAQTQEVIICGWRAGRSGFTGTLGGLLLGGHSLN
jgi:hypothetical protein